MRRASDETRLIHPGTLLRENILPALSLSVSQAARELLVARQTLHRVLGGQAAITPDMAVRLERLCGIPSAFWLDRQFRHDIERAQSENKELLDRIQTRMLPDHIMKKIGALNDG